MNIKLTLKTLSCFLVLSSCVEKSEKNWKKEIQIKSHVEESGDIVKGVYVNGKKYGFWLTRFPTGSPKYERYYVGDRLHGPFIYYHENGKILEIGQYEMGSRNGVFKKYFSDGSMLDSGAYQHDKKSGIWEYYTDSNGEITSSLCFRIRYDLDDTIVLYDAKLIPTLPNGEAEWTKW